MITILFTHERHQIFPKRLVSFLPLKPFTDKKAVRIWKISLNDTQVILKLPPARHILASNQFRSRYLLALIRKHTGNSQFMITS